MSTKRLLGLIYISKDGEIMEMNAGTLVLGLALMFILLPVLMFKLFHVWTRRTSYRLHLEATNTELRSRLELYQNHSNPLRAVQTLSDYKTNGYTDVSVKGKTDLLANEAEINDRQPLHEIKNHISMDAVLKAYPWIESDDVGGAGSVDDDEGEQLTIGFEIAEGKEELVEEKRNLKITQLDSAELPDETFLKKLNFKKTEQKVVVLNREKFSGDYAVKNEQQEHVIEAYQEELPLSVEPSTTYRWCMGSHFLYLRITESHGEVVSCEIIHSVGSPATQTTVLQHPMFASMFVGDTFAAHIKVASWHAEKMVKNVWPMSLEEIEIALMPDELEIVGG